MSSPLPSSPPVVAIGLSDEIEISPASPTVSAPAKSKTHDLTRQTTQAAAAAAGAVASPSPIGTDPAKPATPSSTKVVSGAIAEAISGCKTSIAWAKTAVSAVLDKKSGRTINLHIDQVAAALFFLCLGFNALLVKLLSPSPAYLFTFTLVGVGIGLALSFLYYFNKKQKTEICQVVGRPMEQGHDLDAVSHGHHTCPPQLSF